MSHRKSAEDLQAQILAEFRRSLQNGAFRMELSERS